MQFVRPSKFDEAIAKLGRKTIVNVDLSSQVWGAVPVQIRDRAFFSAHVENARFLQHSKNMISDFLTGARETLPNGETALKAGSRADFVKAMQDHAIASGMGPLDDADKGTIKDITSEARLGLIFDTQTRQAYDYGSYAQGMDADVLDEFPAQRFIRLETVKEPRHSHTEFEDKVFLKTDPIWKRINADFNVPWGPWGWGCGHDVEDVDRDAAEALGLIKPGEIIEPQKHDFNSDLKASTNGMDSETLDQLKTIFGDQVEIDGETIAWKGTQNEQSTDTFQDPSQRGRNDEKNTDVASAIRRDTAPILERIRSRDLRTEVDSRRAQENAVQIGATYLGRKPLFHEEWPIAPDQAQAVVRMLRPKLPKSIQAHAIDSHVYVYNPESIKAIIEADPEAYPGTTLLDKIHQASTTGNNGILLGYGSKTMFAPGNIAVQILDGAGHLVSGFRSGAAVADKYGAARAQDFTLLTGKPHSYVIIK